MTGDVQRVFAAPLRPWWRRILTRGRHHRTWRPRVQSCPVCAPYPLTAGGA